MIATLNPYLVWHDVHENREILDQLLAAAIVLGVLALWQRRSLWLGAILGVLLGLAILGNTRLLFLPIVCCAFLVGRNLRSWILVGVVLAATVLTVTPWVVRNKVSVGCFTITTDTRALWKANNLNTYDTLAAGKWIDDVPPLPNEPPTPEFAGDYYKVYGKVLPVDECARMRFYRHLVVQFWQDHPGEKAKLAGQAAEMLWNPRALKTEGRSESGGIVDKLRTWAQPAYSIPLFLLALVGVFLAPAASRRGWRSRCSRYQTLVAMGFAGATRYRVPWDFLLALAAGGGDLVGGRPEEAGVRVVHVHRIRGIGGSERHLLTLLPGACASTGSSRCSSGSTTPRGRSSRSTRELEVESVRLQCPRDLDAGLARRVRRELARLRPDDRAHASRARRRLRRARSRRGARSSRRSTTTTASGAGRSGSSSGR